MSYDGLYSFVFRGLLADQALDQTERLKRKVGSDGLEKRTFDRLPFELLDTDLVESARRMATVYTAIAAFENGLRGFVRQRLLEEYKEEWWEKGVSEKIRRKSESRRNEEQRIRWHTQRGEDLLDYTELGDLGNIIAVQNWELFEPHLRSPEWVRQIIRTLERSRNVIMHSGELGTEDIERVGTVLRDWQMQVGS